PPLQIFDDCKFHHMPVRQFFDDGRNGFLSCKSAGPETPFAGHYVIAFDGFPHNDRLDYTMFRYGIGKLPETFCIEFSPWLIWIAADFRYVQHEDCFILSG